MFKQAVIFLLLFLSPIAIQAKTLSEYFGKVESLLTQKKYAEAKKELYLLNDKILHYRVDGGSDVRVLFYDTVVYLKEADNFRNILNKGKVSGQICYKSKCHYSSINSENDKFPSKALPFSQNFIDFLNHYHKENVGQYNILNDKLIAAQKLKEDLADAEYARLQDERFWKQAEAREKRQKAQDAARKKEAIKRLRAENAKKTASKAELLSIDNASRKLGFKGFGKENLVRMIYKTQRQGGLENYLDKVVGCPKSDQAYCNKWYPKIKSVQILDNGVLYAFSEYSRNKNFSFMIYVAKEKGKIYQDGQSLSNSFYVFTGILKS